MANIIEEVNCGNSPKMSLIRDINVAFAEADIPFLLDQVTDDFVWEVIGDQTIKGKEAFGKGLDEMKNYVPDTLTIKSVISHGSEGAAHGELAFPDGNTYAFCDMYQFNSAAGKKIKSLTSFVIKTNP